MIISGKAEQLSAIVRQQKEKGRSVGFVPTMGALHSGHLSLIEASKKENDFTVASIFVNPSQFNNPDDFKHYPVTIEKDIEALLGAGCDALFLPPVMEIYPHDLQVRRYDLGPIENILEGFYRPGHFQGVCQAVDRLLQIVEPTRLYLGQKDFQQCLVVKKLLRLLGKQEELALRIVPTRREADGLAMSSRNLRLNPEQRHRAVAIYEELKYIAGHYKTNSFTVLKERATNNLSAQGFHVDYVEIANQADLTPATDTSQPLVVLVAASIGDIRLIDNLVLN